MRSTTTAAAHEHRAFKRLPMRLAVTVLLLDYDGRFYAEGVAQLTNLSRTGIGLSGFRLLRGRLPAGPYELVVTPALPHLQGLCIKATPVRLGYGSQGPVIGARIAQSHPEFDQLLDIVPMVDDRGGRVAKG